jgi:hypothetical protein
LSQAGCRKPPLGHELVAQSDFGFQAFCDKGKNLTVRFEAKAVNRTSECLLVRQSRLKALLTQQFAKRMAEFTEPRVLAAIQDLPHVFRDGHDSRAFLDYSFVQGGSPISVSIRLM